MKIKLFSITLQLATFLLLGSATTASSDALYDDLLFVHLYDATSCDIGNIEAHCTSTAPGGGKEYINGFDSQYWNSLSVIYMSTNKDNSDKAHLYLDVDGKDVYGFGTHLNPDRDYSKILFKIPSYNPGKIIVFNFYEPQAYYNWGEPKFEFNRTIEGMNRSIAKTAQLPVVSFSIPVHVTVQPKHIRYDYTKQYLQFLEANKFLRNINVETSALMRMKTPERAKHWPHDIGLFVFFSKADGDHGSILFHAAFPNTTEEAQGSNRDKRFEAFKAMTEQAISVTKNYFVAE